MASTAESLRRRLDRQAVRHARARQAVAAPAPEIVAPQVEDVARVSLKDFVAAVRWPHIETQEPVSCLTAVTSDMIERMSAGRYDDDGVPIGGSDIVGKARRMQITVTCISILLHRCLSRPHTRAVTMMQSGQDHIVRPLLDDIDLMLGWLPDKWALGRTESGQVERVRRVGRGVYFANGSTYRIMMSGSSEQSASRVGRAGRIDALHCTEFAYWPMPEISMKAALSAVQPSTGWIIAESTFATRRSNYHAVEFERALAGRGRFARAHFWPWHADPLKRLPAGGDECERYLAMDIPEADRRREDQLGLDDEQRAYRRRLYCVGSADDRAQARGEFPEHWEDPFESGGQRWLSASTIQALEHGAAEPEIERVEGELTVRIWDPEPSMVVGGMDTAEKHGIDRTAVVLIDPVAKSVVATIHGRALASEAADATRDLLAQLGHPRAVINVERNRGLAHVDECMRRGIRMYYTRSRGRQSTPVQVPGTLTSAGSRAALIDLVAQAVRPEVGWHVSDERLVTELRQLELVDGRVGAAEQRAEGEQHAAHDDLVMAWALALYASAGRRGSTHGERQAVPSPNRREASSVQPTSRSLNRRQ